MALNYIGMRVGSAITRSLRSSAHLSGGLVISYLLGRSCVRLKIRCSARWRQKLYKKNKRSDGHGFARGMSILFSEIIMLAVIAALIYLIIRSCTAALKRSS